ncbi:hypothetical protein Leryth_012486 [Lithospermum erythrorhizon]|uniref:Uncharacterized protein n=1 Tax=Lithospermum erythrorhizon TaxID=34254 RepID=A0AAV3QFM4_LITER|nr:hypothetical protein Leryth_012486 [Lithospermum erythrorhizon]
MTSINCCQHCPFSTEVWLLLAVISNANGSIIVSSRFFEFPFSWFTTTILINAFRFIFKIKPTMPIAVDLVLSLVFQWVICMGDYGWRLAFTLTSFLNIIIFYVGYLSPQFEEYTRLVKANPETQPLAGLINPLSPLLLASAMFDLYVLNGCLMLIGWFYPRDDKFYVMYQDYVGYFLVKESLIFLSCYHDLRNVTETLSPKGK